MHRWQTVAVSAAAVIGAAGLGFAFHADGFPDQEMELTASETDTSGQQYRFTVNATPVSGLYPGTVKQLKLTFDNPFSFDLTVTDMRANVVSTSNPGCLPISTNLQVQPYTGRFPLMVQAKDSRVAGTVPLRMPNSVANECQRATFTIELSADATRTGR